MAQKRKAGMSEETFDEFLAGQGILEACEDHAIKELIAEQLAAAMKEQGLSKVEMAARMNMSRRQLDRFFDPAIPSVTLDALRRGSRMRSAARCVSIWCDAMMGRKPKQNAYQRCERVSVPGYRHVRARQDIVGNARLSYGAFAGLIAVLSRCASSPEASSKRSKENPGATVQPASV
jgi:hypothetical protein